MNQIVLGKYLLSIVAFTVFGVLVGSILDEFPPFRWMGLIPAVVFLVAMATCKFEEESE
jgi:putative Ca2+/H+ antiporter (TMEM165/GDT1 family)